MGRHDFIRTVELRAYRDTWTADDRHANFKADVACYTSHDPLPTLENLSKGTGIPVECLVRYVLVKWAASGADALMSMRPIAVQQMAGHVASAEREGTDAARLKAYEALKAMLAWLELGE